jgi:DNA polymerase I
MIDDNEEQKSIKKLESELLPILAEMEVTGVRLDREKLMEIGGRIRQDIERYEREIYELAGTTVNLNSPKQVAELLFERLGIK